MNEKNVEGKPFINRESKSLELKIKLDIFYDEHESPSSCNTTVYLSDLLISQLVNVIIFFVENIDSNLLRMNGFSYFWD